MCDAAVVHLLIALAGCRHGRPRRACWRTDQATDLRELNQIVAARKAVSTGTSSMSRLASNDACSIVWNTKLATGRRPDRRQVFTQKPTGPDTFTLGGSPSPLMPWARIMLCGPAPHPGRVEILLVEIETANSCAALAKKMPDLFRLADRGGCGLFDLISK